MRVGLVSPYDFASPGGVNDHIRNMGVQLQRLGHETRIFAPSSRADVDFDSARFYRIGTPIAIQRLFDEPLMVRRRSRIVSSGHVAGGLWTGSCEVRMPPTRQG